MVNSVRPFDAAILAYPWSVNEQGATRAIRATGGATAFSLAAAYHSLRQLDPLSEQNLVREIPNAALYWNPGPAAFTGTIRPIRPPSNLADAYPRARDALGAAGARVGAWVSVLHSTALATAHPQSVLTTATGSLLGHALCPASPDAMEYARAAITDLLTRETPDYLELEATGYHGWRHDSRHDKSAFPISDRLNFLLSMCFCLHCCVAYAEQGGDPELLRHRVSESIRGRLRGHSTLSPDPLDDDDMSILVSARQGVVTRMNAELAARSQELGVPVLIHAGWEPLRTGSRAVLDHLAIGALPGRVGVVVSTDGQTSADQNRTIKQAVLHYEGSAEIYLSRRVWAPDVESEQQLYSDVATAKDEGAAGVRFHTYGLLDEERLRWIGNTVGQVG